MKLDNMEGEEQIPYLSDGSQIGPFEYEDQHLWDNTLRDGLREIEISENIQKIRNYYNGHHNIEGRPPSRNDFNDYLDFLEGCNDKY